MKNFISSLVKQALHGISLTLLSLLLPLSFLLLARLASLLPNTKLLSMILYFYVFSLSFARLMLSIAGRSLTFKAPKSVAWVILGLFQVCISWGVGATVAVSFETVGSHGAGNLVWIKRAFLFVGIYEITMFWRRIFVKPVVDDTVYGEEGEERGVDKVVMGVSFGMLWLWMMRMEVEPLIFSAGHESLGMAAVPLGMLRFTVCMTGILRVIEVLFGSIEFFLKNMGWWEEMKDGDCIEDKV